MDKYKLRNGITIDEIDSILKEKKYEIRHDIFQNNPCYNYSVILTPATSLKIRIRSNGKRLVYRFFKDTRIRFNSIGEEQNPKFTSKDQWKNSHVTIRYKQELSMLEETGILVKKLKYGKKSK